MTTNHPDPTPPPAEPAPSLRPVEELQALCDADLVAIQARVARVTAARPHLMSLRQSDLAQSVRDLSALAAALPSLLARLRAAEETLAAVERLAAIYERTAEFDPTGEFYKRAIDLRAVLAEGASR